MLQIFWTRWWILFLHHVIMCTNDQYRRVRSSCLKIFTKNKTLPSLSITILKHIEKHLFENHNIYSKFLSKFYKVGHKPDSNTVDPLVRILLRSRKMIVTEANVSICLRKTKVFYRYFPLISWYSCLGWFTPSCNHLNKIHIHEFISIVRTSLFSFS